MTGLKIGILTFHRCINYGSYWQARCLAEALLACGHQAEIMDHQSERVNFAEWKTALQPVLPTPVPEPDHAIYRVKLFKFFCAFKSLPLSPPFPLEHPEKSETYDLVIVGSDEVWNLMHPWYSHYPIFYGDGLHTQRLVSYAASFGNYPDSWGINSDWAEKLKNFDLISVRDENSQNIVKNAIGTDPEIVLDPCLLFPVQAEKRKYENLQQPYLAVYGHNFSKAFTKQVRNFAHGKNLKLISIGYRNNWADEQWIVADPHDFANFISGAEAVATNFFHGSVFAMINHKPFVCEGTQYRSNKLQGLLSLLGAESRLMQENSGNDEFNTCLTHPAIPTTYQKLEKLRQSSKNFLHRVLKLNLRQPA